LGGTASGARKALRKRAKASTSALESLATKANSNARNITDRSQTSPLTRSTLTLALLCVLSCALLSLVFACAHLSVADVFMTEHSVDALIAENKLLKQRLAAVSAIRSNKDLLPPSADAAVTLAASAGDNQGTLPPVKKNNEKKKKKKNSFFSS
jgi:hypothetical protein